MQIRNHGLDFKTGRLTMLRQPRTHPHAISSVRKRGVHIPLSALLMCAESLHTQKKRLFPNAIILSFGGIYEGGGWTRKNESEWRDNSRKSSVRSSKSRVSGPMCHTNHPHGRILKQAKLLGNAIAVGSGELLLFVVLGQFSVYCAKAPSIHHLAL